MRQDDFFIEVELKDWTDPWSATRNVFDVELASQLVSEPHTGFSDLDAARALAGLVKEQLIAKGTSGSVRLTDEDMAVALRALRAVLRRLGIDFAPPFRDLTGFTDFWIRNGMTGSGSWSVRRAYVTDFLRPVLDGLDGIEDARAGTADLRGAGGELRNLIFASTGPKPQIVLSDAISNVIEVTRNAEYCLFYDRPLTAAGLTWGELTDWWRTACPAYGPDTPDSRGLYRRLIRSLGDNKAERLVFATYCARYADDDADALPALLPQVYLHYDPLTRRQRGGQPSVLTRERMDFLLLLPDQKRIVMEVDGQQHYADGDRASPRLYSEMVAADRNLYLAGYDVLRFGGYEILTASGAAPMLREFFDRLLATCSSE
jgi:hypothetical protein